MRLSNNVAELAAVTIALEWLRTAGVRGQVVLFYDSDYSRNITTGEWKPRSNFKLAARAKRAYRAILDIASLHVGWHHIDSHTGCLLNERADKLAARGARGVLRALP